MSEERSQRAARAGRIVLDTFRSAQDPMLRSWLRFRAQLTGEVAPAALRPPAPPALGAAAGAAIGAVGGVYGVWRVLATNNRELGRGAAVHAGPAAALAEAERIVRDAAALVPQVMRGSQPMTHGWVLRHDGRIAVTSARWYESASEAGAAARSARSVLADAVVVGGVSLRTRSGRRQRRSLVPDESRE